jgi:hypothetical protein
MMFITLAYLTIEVPFSVYLVKFMGGNPSVSDVDSIEFFGRILTGCAVAIFVVGTCVLPRLNFKKSYILTVFWISVSSFISVFGTFHSLNYIADYLGTSSSPEERRIAFQTNVVKRQISAHGLGGMEISNSNDWLAFVSAIPTLGATSDELFAMSNVSKSEMINDESYRALGDLVAARKFFSVERLSATRIIYDEYQIAVGRYHEALKDLDREANRAYNTFEDLARVKSNGLWYWYNKKKKAEVARTELRKHGLVFSSRENPLDRDVFGYVFGKKYKGKVLDTFSKGMIEAFGSNLSPDLAFDEFSNHPAVHKKIRAVLHLPKSDVSLDGAMSDVDFNRLVYIPLAKKNAELFSRAFDAPASKFANGEEFEKLGTSAVKMIRVPVMAILLSIAGAMLHIYKFSTYLIQVLAGRAKLHFINTGVRHAFGFSIMMVAFIGMGLSGNVVTSNIAFAQIKSDGPVAHLMHGAIAIQPEFSKLGRGFGSIGPWNLIVSHLPAPVLYKDAKIAKGAIAPVSELAVYAEDVTLENIPVPTPRPERVSN